MSRSNIVPASEANVDLAQTGVTELSDDQLSNVYGGEGISAAPATIRAFIPPTTGPTFPTEPSSEPK
jgi:bacteriocin-like protein